MPRVATEMPTLPLAFTNSKFLQKLAVRSKLRVQTSLANGVRKCLKSNC